jgi:hypothetical protein
MTSFIEQQAMRMRAKAEELRTARAEHQAKVAQEQVELARPMVERVRDAIAAMPPEDVASGIKLEELAGMIKGRYKGHAQPKEVAAALRALNFERIRCWRDTDLGFRSTWHRKEDK